MSFSHMIRINYASLEPFLHAPIFGTRLYSTAGSTYQWCLQTASVIWGQFALLLLQEGRIHKTWPIAQVSELHHARYLLQPRALELFMYNHASALLSFETPKASSHTIFPPALSASPFFPVGEASLVPPHLPPPLSPICLLYCN